MKKLIALLILAAFLATTALVGCGGSTSPPKATGSSTPPKEKDKG